MTLVHIGIFTAGVVAGWMLAKNAKKTSFANLTAKPKSYMVTCADGTTFRLTPNSPYGADCTNHGGIKNIKAI